MTTDRPPRTAHTATLATAIAALVALALAACGSNNDNGDSGSPDQADNSTPAADTATNNTDNDSNTTDDADDDETQIKAVYNSLVDAVYKGDGKTACSHLTPKIRQELAKRDNTTCAQYIQNALADPTKEHPRIYQLQVQGNRALAKAGTPKTNKYPVPFTKNNQGTWQISGGY